MTHPPDRSARLDALLAERDLAAIWVAQPATFAWLTGGSNVVDRAGDIGVAAACYDGDLTVVTNNIEAERLATEELSNDIPVEAFDWHDSSLAAAVEDRTPTPAAADFSVAALERLDASRLRQPLTDRDITVYRRLGRETAGAVETVCRDADPSDTERQVAARLRGRLAESGIETPVTLVGGSTRAQRYRHYTPTDTELGAYALVSVTAQRDGLYASCTRTVAFDPPEWLAERHRAATRVETTALAATQAAGHGEEAAGDVFAQIQSAYEAVGYAGEWCEHHQGGAAGFAGREWIATPDAAHPVRLPMAYAWNPTVQGAKSEDTVLVTDQDIEPLTQTGDWPTREVSAVNDDLTLDRPDVLRV